MQITINKKKFIDALTIGGAMAGKHKVLPILDYAKVEVCDGMLSVHSFNSETWVMKSVRAENTDSNFSFCINPNDLVKALKSLAEEIVTFSIEGTSFVLNHFKGEIEMPTMQAEEFPRETDVQSGLELTIDTDNIKSWLGIASDFVGNDELRLVMTGMCLFAKNGKLGACATDAHKLWRSTVDYTCDDFSVTIPPSGFHALASVLKNKQSVNIMVGSNNISFITDDAMVHSRLVEGKYPNVDAVIPTSYSINVKIHKAELEDSLNRVSLFADNATSRLKLSIGGNKMIIEGEDTSLLRKAKDSVSIEHSGSAIVVGIKSDLITTCLSHFISDDVVLKMNGADKPIVFEDASDPNKTMLIMPMLIS